MRFGTLLGALFLGLSLLAQAPPNQQNIKVSVNEVIVPVTVTDDKDRFVADLEEKDFEIYDEG